jgi:uncharacterized protein YhfF
LDEFWTAFCTATGFAGQMPAAMRFGDGKAQQDELCALVLAGRKQATASLAFWYGDDRAAVPRPGDLSIVCDGAGVPRGVIETRGVFEVAFDDVDMAFAADEGEGDGSLDYWRDEHRRFFGRELAAEGLVFAGTIRVICERFRLVWRRET